MVFRSFRGRLAVSIGALVMGSGLLLAAWLGQLMAEQRVQAQGRTLQEMARSIGVVLGAGLDDRLAQIESLAGQDLFPYARTLSGVNDGTLDRIAATRTHYSWIGLVDQGGRVRAATRGMLVGQSVQARAWFQQGLQGTHAGDVHPAKLLATLLPAGADGGPPRFLDFASPVRNAEGLVIGVLGAHVNWDWTRDMIASLAREGDREDGIEVWLLDREGRVILRPVGVAADAAVPALPAGDAGLAGDAQSGHLAARAALSAHLAPNRLGWTVLVRQPAPLALAPALHARAAVWRIGAGIAAVAMLVVWWMAGAFARPLVGMAEAARAIETGAREQPMPRPGGSSELQQLGAALTGMTQALLGRERALREANEQLDARVRQRTAELEHANAELLTLARTDGLTGLPNRRVAEERLLTEWRRHQRHGHEMALLMIDIDRFKQVNDSHGHAAGDAVLKAVGGALLQGCRSSDLVARLGGEEFFVLLPETGAEGSVATAEKLRAAVEALATAPVGRVTVSIGIALSGDGWRNAKAALAAADEALYAAKAGGRNRVVLQRAAEGAPA